MPLTDLQDEVVAAYLDEAPADLSIIDAYEAAATRAFNDLTDDLRPRVYAALLIAAAGASVMTMLPKLADAFLDRETLLDALHSGLEVLRDGFPTGIDAGLSHNGRMTKKAR
ncbi:hypothetical protein GCM10011575_25520 [Microlunatus endophyticus]|uniref:Uncharacterized protein n=1 Tax=Microlunatus endophyticus TaxID=1716077 RepID=A0A917SC02_9ACTN|nr:hypothetical protein [Microlunatus endophyticus]GGL65972.1 hypothetical protein GCM10011575_25520 [Microlunatus endophyticus]